MAALPYRQDTAHCSEPACTTGPKAAALQQWQAKLPQALATLQQQVKDLPVLQLPAREDDLKEIEEVAKYLRGFKRLFVFGTGGSSLGGKTLVALKQGALDVPDFPVQFVENVDPYSLRALLQQEGLEEAAFLCVSKSGGTVETLSQTLLVLDLLIKRLGKEAVAKQMICVTEPGTRPLRQLAEHYGLRVLDHDPNVGGRFSVLSNVGLIPAAAAGLDIRALRRGAQAVLETTLKSADAPAAIGAVMHAASMKTHPIHVLMPYCDRLESFAAWFQQLWAESIGKDGHGTIAVRALGAVDQHSQLQLYLDGPRDKIFTLLLPDFADADPVIPASHVPSLAYLEGHRLGTVMQSMQHGTLESLKAQGCPVRTLRIAQVDEATLGALLMHFELETILTASLLGIDAFNQPAVEQSKQLARAYLQEHRVAPAA